MICHTCSVRTFVDSAIVLCSPSVDFFTASWSRFFPQIDLATALGEEVPDLNAGPQRFGR
jgi:hypothetical protein